EPTPPEAGFDRRTGAAWVDGPPQETAAAEFSLPADAATSPATEAEDSPAHAGSPRRDPAAGGDEAVVAAIAAGGDDVGAHGADAAVGAEGERRGEAGVVALQPFQGGDQLLPREVAAGALQRLEERLSGGEGGELHGRGTGRRLEARTELPVELGAAARQVRRQGREGEEDPAREARPRSRGAGERSQKEEVGGGAGGSESRLRRPGIGRRAEEEEGAGGRRRSDGRAGVSRRVLDLREIDGRSVSLPRALVADRRRHLRQLSPRPRHHGPRPGPLATIALQGEVGQRPRLLLEAGEEIEHPAVPGRASGRMDREGPDRRDLP